uniref:Serpentine receptor class gamma n=1 Tax=Panagrellus redivivus TaxID=6233 RepID=A0A7E4VZF7_PANRE
MGLCLLAPLTVSWHNWVTQMMICESGGMYSWDHSARLSWWSSSRSSTVVFFVTLLPSLTMNLYVSYFLCQKQKQTRSSVDRVKSSDKQLFFFTVTVFIAQMFNFGIQFMFTFSAFRAFAYEDLIIIQFYTMDVAMLFPAWSLLLTSREFRKHFMELLGLRSLATEIEVSTMSTSQPKSVAYNHANIIKVSSHA